MRYAILSILLLSLLSGCNRDATDATSPDGTFLSPADQPESIKMPAKAEDTRPREGTKMITDPGEAQLPEGDRVISARLSEEDLAAAHRPGSRRPGTTTSRATTAPPPSAPTTQNIDNMPTPPTAGRPAIEYDRPIFAISKTPCYGDCEQYSLTLTNDRQLILKAKKHMDKKGEYRLRLNAQEYNTLLNGLDSLDLNHLMEVYPKNIKMIPADAQATVLRFPDNDTGGEEMKKVEVYFDAPEQLASFLERFEAMVNRTDWKLVKP